MGNDNKKGKLRGKKFVWFERMLRREGRKLCAVALCASMIIGNMAWPAAAANDTSGEYSFELTSESLFNAIQDAIAEGAVVDTELDLKGSAAEEYQSFLEAGSSLYEIEPVIDNDDSDRDKVLDLRAFVRLENDIELDSAYVMDGSEEITFLLVNSSDVYQQATISVDGRESETITVLPASAVAVDEEEAGPGVSGTANYSNTTVTESDSVSSGSGGGGGSSSGVAGSTQINESAADDDDTADIVIENNEIDDNKDEQGSVVEVQPEEGSDEEEQEPEKEDDSAKNQPDDADADGTDEDESGTQDETGDVSAEEDKDNNPEGTSDPAADENTNNEGNTDDNTTDGRSENEPDEQEDSGMTNNSGSDWADEDGGSGTDKSGNNNTADDQDSNSGEEAEDENGEAGSGEAVASAISVHTTYLLAASATPSDAEEATPSDASGLNGGAYETVLLESKAVVAYVTTAEELELDKIETILYTAELDDVVFSVNAPVGALPWGVELRASEYDKDSETYQSRYAETINLIDELDEEEDHTEEIRLFNVGFYDTDGAEVEPTEKVNVTITYLDADADDVGQVVHFGGEETEVIDVETDYNEDGNKNIAYELESFSDTLTIAAGPGGGGQTSSNTISVYWDTITKDTNSITAQNSEEGIESVTISGGSATNSGVVAHEDGKVGSGWTKTTAKITQTNTSDETVRLTISPENGYYVTYITVCCTTGNQSPTECMTYGNGDAYNSTYSISDMGNITIDVPLNKEEGFNHGTNCSTYFVLIAVAKIPSPLYVEYDYGNIVNNLKEDGYSYDAFDTANGWTATSSGNDYGSTGSGDSSTNGVMTNDTQYKYTYADDSNSYNAGWKHYANSITNEATAQAAADGYYFAGWQATYYTTCDVEGSSGDYNNYNYLFSNQYGTSSDYYQPGASVNLTVHVQLVAIWVKPTVTPGSLTITKTFEGLPEGTTVDSITFTVTKNGDGSFDELPVTLSDDNEWTQTIGDLNAGTYTITETEYEVEGYSCTTTVNGTGVEEGSTEVELKGYLTSTYNDSTGLYEYTAAVENAEVGFVNTYIKKVSVTVTKTVTGRMGERNRDFSFTATVIGSDNETDLIDEIAGTYAENGDGKYEKNESGIGLTQDISNLGESKCGFTLKSGQSITFTVPYGTSFTVSEDDYSEDGYTTTIDEEDVREKTVTAENDSTEIKVINKKEVKSPTGIYTEYLPYALMMMAALLGGVWLVNDRRKKIYVDREQ